MELTRRDLKILGAALYLCEGTKARKYPDGRKYFAVEFTNKDPRVIRIFMKFLREIIVAEEQRVKAQLFIYPDHNEAKLKNFWSSLTNIPKERFNKTIKLEQKSLKFKPNPLGVLKIRYTHKRHYLKVSNIINQIFD